MINKSTFDTIHAGKFVLHSYLINDINGCKGTIYIRRHCLLHYIIIMRFLWAMPEPLHCGTSDRTGSTFSCIYTNHLLIMPIW